MPIPAGQAQIQQRIVDWIRGTLTNTSFGQYTEAWNYLLNSGAPDMAASIYQLVSTAGYAGGGLMNKTGTISATGPTSTNTSDGSFSGIGDFNVSIWSANPAQPFSGSVKVERSFDGGANWLAFTALSEDLSLNGTFSTTFSEPEPNVIYRLNCTSFTGGSANWRFSQ